MTKRHRKILSDNSAICEKVSTPNEMPLPGLVGVPLERVEGVVDAAAVVGRGLLEEARVDRLEVGRLQRGGGVVVGAVDGVVAVGHLNLAGHQVGRHERRVGILDLKSSW